MEHASFLPPNFIMVGTPRTAVVIKDMDNSVVKGIKTFYGVDTIPKGSIITWFDIKRNYYETDSRLCQKQHIQVIIISDKIRNIRFKYKPYWMQQVPNDNLRYAEEAENFNWISEHLDKISRLILTEANNGVDPFPRKQKNFTNRTR